MSKFISKVQFWYKNSRPYTAPITFLSWLVIFLYSIKQGGNILYGIIAYIGIAIVHLATNLSDDYFDYKRLSADPSFFSKAKASKCKYLRDGSANLKELKRVLVLLFSLAGIIGAYLFFASGYYVLLFAFVAFIISITYSKLSAKGLGDIAVIIAYGPLMFCGVFYVMTGKMSFYPFILSIPCALFVNAILFSSMILDYDEDITSGKLTLCTRLNSKNNALNLFLILYFLAFLLIVFVSIFFKNPYFLCSFILLPLIYDLYLSLKIYNNDRFYLPKVRFWNYPLDNWADIKDKSVAPYFLRFYFTRNITICFLFIMSISIIAK